MPSQARQINWSFSTSRSIQTISGSGDTSCSVCSRPSSCLENKNLRFLKFIFWDSFFETLFSRFLINESIHFWKFSFEIYFLRFILWNSFVRFICKDLRLFFEIHFWDLFFCWDFWDSFFEIIRKKNRNFGQKLKFRTKIEILYKNWNFVQKLKFCTRIKILDKNRTFGQKLKSWTKNSFVRFIFKDLRIIFEISFLRFTFLLKFIFEIQKFR